MERKEQLIYYKNGLKNLKRNNMKLQIVETEDYVLAVSDEEIKYDEYYVSLEKNYSTEPRERYIIYVKSTSLNGNNPKKIIAYKPKYTKSVTEPVYDKEYYNTDADNVWKYRPNPCPFPYWGNIETLREITPELDLPLLPEIVNKNDVEKLADDYFVELNKINKYDDNYQNQSKIIRDFKAGYRTATKIYSEEDLRKALNEKAIHFKIDYTKEFGVNGKYTKSDDEIIQSLKQPKTPKWFVAEFHGPKMVYSEQYETMIHNPDCYMLKTISINNKTYLVGTYLYE
jgi:hypothetical protein